MKKQKYRSLLLAPFCSLFAISCSTIPQHQEVAVPGIALRDLHFRRPSVPSANPNAIAGDEDYEAETASDEAFNCRPLPELFEEIDLTSVKDCIATLNKSTEETSVTYTLKREVTPYLELDDLKKAPSCLQKALPRIAVPREIFFQTQVKEEDEKLPKWECYSSHLDAKTKKWLGIGNPLHKDQVKIVFPMEDLLETTDEVTDLLGSWTLSPFLGSDESFESTVVSEEICRSCLGEKAFKKVYDPAVPLWPSSKGEE